MKTPTVTAPARRHFLALSLGAAGALALGVRAAPIPGQQADAMAMQIAGAAGREEDETAAPPKPYTLITPPVTEDREQVRGFFSYACPHCRQYHNGLSQWGRSLPPPLSYIPTPIVTDPGDDNQILAVYGRLICAAVAPEKVSAYDVLAFELIGQGTDGAGYSVTLTPQRILRELSQLGIPTPAIQAYVGNARNMKSLEQAIASSVEVIKRYGIMVTPAVAIMGKLLVTPDNANGNPQQFVQLLNGLISQVMA